MAYEPGECSQRASERANARKRSQALAPLLLAAFHRTLLSAHALLLRRLLLLFGAHSVVSLAPTCRFRDTIYLNNLMACTSTCLLVRLPHRFLLGSQCCCRLP